MLHVACCLLYVPHIVKFNVHHNYERLISSKTPGALVVGGEVSGVAITGSRVKVVSK